MLPDTVQDLLRTPALSPDQARTLVEHAVTTQEADADVFACHWLPALEEASLRWPSPLLTLKSLDELEHVTHVLRCGTMALSIRAVLFPSDPLNAARVSGRIGCVGSYAYRAILRA